MSSRTQSEVATVITPPAATANPLRSRADWQAARDAVLADPGAFHGALAGRLLHWFVPSEGKAGAWLTHDPASGRWSGFDATDGTPLATALDGSFVPWQRAFDDSHAPVYRWFSGGLTNACFNEVDRHVLASHGDELALIFEGDRWDQSLDGGRGGPVVSDPISRKRLLLEVAKAALVLRALGVRTGDRIALNMPNIPEQVYYTEAAKRLGIVYTPVFGGFSDKTLSDRIHDAGARVVITADGGWRNAQIVPFKEVYTDAALDNYVPVDTALAIVRDALAALAVDPEHAARIAEAAAAGLAGEITVERSDVMRGVGRALQALASGHGGLAAAEAARIRTGIARALVDTPQRVDAVVVVRYTGQPNLTWRAGRDRWSHELAADASARLVEAARRRGHAVADEAALLALPDREFVAAVWSVCPPLPVDAEYPLFIIYTSGSTGKPKGVVHVHGGWLAGVAATMPVAFDAKPGDTMYVVADPGWITGQSYMIAGALATRVTSLIVEAAPVFPSAGRFASIIERYRVAIFKAGVTFLKSVMGDPQNAEDVRRYRLDSLRVATFCAEPTSPAVQAFGMQLMTPWYINSYWATEHGGIVWTHFYGNGDFPLRADAHTYPLPWVLGDVWVADGDAIDGRVPARRADHGEKGEIVITAPYPYLARTIWGDAAGFRVDCDATSVRVAPTWRGDADRWASTYWRRWQGTYAYTQGDFAIRHADGGYSLHGRSDDVINVSGHRIGTEEIEGAILRDKQVNPDSPVANAIVVGAPHREKGLTPIAFVKPVPGRKLGADDRRRLTDLVRSEKGATAVPSDFIEVSQFPETRSGKYMRRMVRALVEEQPVGDTSTLRNPEAIAEIAAAIGAWRQRQRASDEQRLFETWRYLRVQYHALAPGRRVAVVTIANPPVNALNERALDELVTVVDHLARRDDIAVVVFTGAGSGSFVAGADIRQLLDDVHTLDEAQPLPNNAHLAFRKIEAMTKPTIAAINGVALGGGLEFAMACHYRVAEPTSSFGQPEIRLRLLPGYGGTQRLPRLLVDRASADARAAALVRAITLLIGGRSLDAADAAEIGLVDEIAAAPADVLTRAVDLARGYVAGSNGVLADAYDARRRQTAGWEQPGPVPLDAALADTDVQRMLTQSRGAGRGVAVERLLDALATGWNQGIAAGLAREARLFAEAVVDPDGGKRGIRDFIERRAAALPTRPEPPRASPQELVAKGELLPVGSPFFPGFTPIPPLQYAFAVTRDRQTGEPVFGDPRVSEREVIVPVETPGPNEALVYLLTSEVNFNDVWALVGIPISPFDSHDEDVHVTGSGGMGLVVAAGEAVKREGRVKIGDLCVVFAGQYDLLAPVVGLDPMFADFHIQGYESPNGSHQQFLLVQGPQLHPLPADLTLEQAGSYCLNLGTVVRALFTVLRIEPGRAIFVEGAATGTGLEALKTARRNGLTALGMVSSEDRAAVVRAEGGVPLNRKDPRYAGIFTIVPRGPEAIARWIEAGRAFVADAHAANGGRGVDYAVSHAGEQAFPRSFQLLADGGVLTFYGASSGYYFSFAGKPGSLPAQDMLRRAGLRGGEAVLVWYGSGLADGELVDAGGLEAIEAARASGARIAVITITDAQREFVQSLGFGEAIRGVASIAEIGRRAGKDFDWPDGLPELPDTRTEIGAFREAVRDFQERTLKPIGAIVGRFLRSADNPKGQPELIIERAGHDALAVSTSLVMPYTGRVIYFEDMTARRYTFYAPQVWYRHRRILMPTAEIRGTHLNNPHEVTMMNRMVDAGLLGVTEPVVVPWSGLPEAHQAMWDNRHAGANYVVNHAIPASGLRSRDELFEAWAAAIEDNQGEGHE
jgi:acrylyl-CoA reductase (NADPH)/3-hydroxypropionyl-CoA dehydratase/3-hydroxypropionyl-CoA synthetase